MAPKDSAAATIEWRSVFAQSPAATCIVAADGIIVDANTALAALSGHAVGDLVGRPFDLLAPLNGTTNPARPCWVPADERGSAILRRPDGVERGVSFAITRLGGGLRLVTLADVTDDQCFVCAVFSSREKFRTAFDDQTELICRFTPDLTVTLVNRPFAAACGLTPRRFVGLDLYRFLPAATLAEVKRFVRDATPQSPMAASEERWPTGDGSVRWITWRRVALFDQDDRLVAVQSVGRDTTQRRLAEEERLRLAGMINRSPVVGLVWRLGGRLIIDYATENIARFGLDRAALLTGKVGLLDLLEPEDAVTVAGWGLEDDRAPVTRQLSVRLRSASGPGRWVSLTAWPAADGHMEAVLADVTEQRAANLALRERERRFRAIFHHTFEFIGLLGPDGRLLEANDTALHFIGATEADVLGRQFWDTPWWAHSPDDQQRLKDGLARALRGEFVRFETTHSSPDGRVLDIDFSLRPIVEEDGTVSLVVPEGRDITPIKRTQAALLEAKREAEAANRSKTQFLAVMSHELRTPLNAILGYSEVMQSALFGPIGNERYNGYAEAIHSSGRHLLGIIDDILEVSRIELGVVELSEDVAPASDLMERAVQMIATRASESGVELETDVPDDLPLLRCDSRRVIQMLVNLAINGVKFSGCGGRVHLAAARTEEGGLAFVVRDDGVGIAPEDQSRIWEAFGQAEATQGRQGGVGLGLTITKALIEAHGGTVTLNSAPGEGTTVTLRFPPERCREAATLGVGRELDLA